MKQTLIEIKNFSKSFKDKGMIFDNLNLDIYPNEHLALVAKNGIGKTVLLETIIGLRKITKGEIKWNYEFKSTPYEEIGFLFQSENLLNNFYVSDYIDLLKNDKKVDKIFLENLLTKFNIKEILPMSIANLSGGQKQILKVIITFVHNPKLIILDEFDNNLDAQIKKQVLDFVKNYAKERHSTLILVSHDFEDIKQICSKVAFLKNGKIDKIISTDKMTLEQFKSYL